MRTNFESRIARCHKSVTEVVVGPRLGSKIMRCKTQGDVEGDRDDEGDREADLEDVEGDPVDVEGDEAGKL